MTLSYLDGNDPHNPRVGRYYNAVAEWEAFAIDVTIACDLFKWLNQDQGAFAKHDGSKEYRLYEIGNRVKHMASCVRSGQCAPDDTLPLWINKLGLNSFGIVVAYDEAADILADICAVADELQDPISFREKARSTAAGSSTADAHEGRVES
jgi:hypothetical protein